MLLANKKEIFYNLVVERTREIEKLYNKANFQNLIYHFNGPTKEINFHDCNDAERNLLIQIARGH